MLEQTRIINELMAGTQSPIAFDNSLYYAARMTGTGDVWRSAHGDMYRPGDYYMTPEFLARCAGVPVIMNHPDESATINPANVKIVGTVIHAYPHPDDPTEIWCVMRIIDGFIQEELLTKILSTSPSIVVGKSVLSDGVLVEGAPVAAPDHLAICELGVWDHKGPATGIDQTIVDYEASDAIRVQLEENAHSESLTDSVSNCQFDTDGTGSARPIDWLARIEPPVRRTFDLASVH